MTTEQYPVIVVGGGGAGLVAAWRAATLGARVIILERNRKIGIKLLISGGGKCNITHAGPMEDVRSAFLQREARFLKPSFYRFTNDDIIRMVEDEGVKTYTRDNGRVFPENGRADDVVDALKTHLARAGVETRPGTTVEEVTRDGDHITGVTANQKHIPASHVIVATGGVSYPKTGTTGDGFRWVRELGHAVVPLRPALAPIGIEPPLPTDWSGVAVRGGRLSVYSGLRKVFDWNDDILFTHEGVSGPAALEVSRMASEYSERAPVFLHMDFLPKTEFQELDEELLTLVSNHRAKRVGTLLERWVPNRMIPYLLQYINVPIELRGFTLTRDQRRAVVGLLKSWNMGRVARIDITRGEVTAGGVALDEVDPRTMRSRIVKGLYLCGEILDIAGPVGGYNLQAAFSTGYVAGETAAQDWLQHFTTAARTVERS